LEEITVKEEAAYLTGSDQSQDMQLDQTFQLDLLTEKERIVIFLMFEKSISAAAIARRWGCSRQSVNQIKLKALNKLKSQISAHSSSGGGDSK
jgi:DNA-directed RNA polymerase specialized sigma subunit